MKKIVIDIDNTIAGPKIESYADCAVIHEVVSKIQEYKSMGFIIALYTARNMQTYNCNTGKIIANTLPTLLEWLSKHNIPYDEIHVGKPWCGEEGFYVDDRAIRPNEFTNLSLDEIQLLLSKN